MTLISTHAPRTGSDVNIFQVFEPGEEISTHAPRTGSDQGRRGVFHPDFYFNPRSPHGERR